MSDKKVEDIAAALKSLSSNMTIAARKKLYESAGVPYQHPSFYEQIKGNGKLEERHRGRALTAARMFVIPAVETEDGKTLAGFMVDPRMARAAAAELIRLAEIHKL